MGWKVITPPSVEPLTLAEVKARLSINDTLDDADITAHITAAREAAESYTGLALIDTEIELALDAFPSEIALPIMPVSSITSVTYQDADNVTQALAASDYVFDDYSPIHRIVPASGVDWPDTYDTINAVRVKFTAGYGAAGSDVPEAIRNALLIAVGHWIRFQAEAESGVGPTRMPMQFFDLLNPYRIVKAC